MVAWGHLNGTSRGDWLGVPPGGGAFSVPFTNMAAFRDDLMVGESSRSSSIGARPRARLIA
jgi:hypothetical protein